MAGATDGSLCVLLCLVAFTFAVKSGPNDDTSEASSGYVVGVGEEDAGRGMRTRAEDEKEARFSHWEEGGRRTKRRNGSTLRREKAYGKVLKIFARRFGVVFGVEHERDEEEKREVNIINDDDDEDDECVTERTIYRRKRRQLLISRALEMFIINGLTMPTGCDEKGFVKRANFGEGAKPSVTFKNEGEKMLKKCVETTNTRRGLREYKGS